MTTRRTGTVLPRAAAGWETLGVRNKVRLHRILYFWEYFNMFDGNVLRSKILE